ncbi:DoxX family membrane protein [Flavobacterium capsici]|uniref:DoxX family membrane protein n=1 Tax=Flavobacterium capsici TaxID=3075618 RepID=A0AA96J5J0_9FLAO|nr:MULTISPECIES: DoxX family membrane protein [unclassified Flavobacterium]WNM18449.1 DoxX family membrane protein [Flavobacterium sp. PMR2A8]WNM22500.1 DoxX family membrane protein [Flavobacterium sp. PMTSA4]
MKIATIIVRVLLGLTFIYTSMSFFLKLDPQTASTDSFKAFHAGLAVSSYIIPLEKAIELLCGLSFLMGRYTTLANVVIFPVTINILLINYFLTPETLLFAIAIFLGNLFLIYGHWENYKPLFKAQ